MNAADRFFIDTNLLLYAYDPADRAKQEAARRWLDVLWQQAAGAISWQVLHEFYVNAIRKLQTPSPRARAVVEAFALWQPVELSLGLIQRAWHWADHVSLSYWDSLIVAAAERAGCRWLLTEDMQDGRKLGSIIVLNPFPRSPEEFGLVSTRPPRQ